MRASGRVGMPGRGWTLLGSNRLPSEVRMRSVAHEDPSLNRKNALLFFVLGFASPNNGEGRTQAAAPDEQQLSADATIVRRLLDQNGLEKVLVSHVAVERNGRVVELKLFGTKTSRKNLPSSLRSIPPEIGKLENLENLGIASNELPELPDTISDLVNLTELDLSNNGLESLSPEIGQLKRLRKLDLSMNRLIEVPASIGDLSQLTELNLMGNKLRRLPEGIGSLVQLGSLGVRSNFLNGLPASTAKLKRLRTLDLIENRLEEVPEVIYGLPSLQSLYLSQNKIQQISPKMGSLVRLQSLTLDHNKLTTLPDEMRELVSLDYFSIEANYIEDIDTTLERIFPGNRKPRISNGPQAMNPKQATDSAFTISKVAPLPNGRPVIDIKPNGKSRPEGTGPSGSYFLIVRRNGVAYYTRWFSPKEAATGTQYDLNIPNIGLEPADKLTVGVENINGSDASKPVKLSNVLDVPHPSPAISTPKRPR